MGRPLVRQPDSAFAEAFRRSRFRVQSGLRQRGFGSRLARAERCFPDAGLPVCALYLEPARTAPRSRTSPWWVFDETKIGRPWVRMRRFRRRWDRRVLRDRHSQPALFPVHDASTSLSLKMSPRTTEAPSSTTCRRSDSGQFVFDPYFVDLTRSATTTVHREEPTEQSRPALYTCPGAGGGNFRDISRNCWQPGRARSRMSERTVT